MSRYAGSHEPVEVFTPLDERLIYQKAKTRRISMYQKICLNCGCDFLASHDWKTYCIPCFIKIQKAKESQNQTHQSICIDDEMMLRLIRLCHPDKHKNSEASNKATVFLLSLRKELKGE